MDRAVWVGDMGASRTVFLSPQESRRRSRTHFHVLNESTEPKIEVSLSLLFYPRVPVARSKHARLRKQRLGRGLDSAESRRERPIT